MQLRMYRYKYFAQNIPDLEAGGRHLSFAITLIILIHSIPFTVNQVFTTVEANILFRQILEDRIWVVDTRNNLRHGFFLKKRDNLLQGFFSLLDPVFLRTAFMQRS